MKTILHDLIPRISCPFTFFIHWKRTHLKLFAIHRKSHIKKIKFPIYAEYIHTPERKFICRCTLTSNDKFRCRGILDWTLDTFVLISKTLLISTLLLSIPCINGYSVGCEPYLLLDVCPPELAPGQNAPLGVEKVHYKCRTDIESNDW